jgi:hypothetical protein
MRLEGTLEQRLLHATLRGKQTVIIAYNEITCIWNEYVMKEI